MVESGAYSLQLLPLLEQMQPITLDQMHSIRLMNRTDTKFVTNLQCFLQILERIRAAYYVQEIDRLRVADYQTIYWDLPDHRFYAMHHNRKYPRQKVRVRTYCDSDISFLEVKQKNNRRRTNKVRMMVPAPDRLIEAGGDSFLKEHLRLRLSDLQPVVMNRFHRVTLVNKEKTERLTVDLDLRFRNLETGEETDMDNLVIIELKRDGYVASPILSVLRDLRVRPLGFSKYCVGSVLTNGTLKKNRFKRRIHDIRKRMQTNNYSL